MDERQKLAFSYLITIIAFRNIIKQEVVMAKNMQDNIDRLAKLVNSEYSDYYVKECIENVVEKLTGDLAKDVVAAKIIAIDHINSELEDFRLNVIYLDSNEIKKEKMVVVDLMDPDNF